MDFLKPLYYFEGVQEKYHKILAVNHIWEAIDKIEGYVKEETRREKVIIGKNTRISEKAEIEGPCVIGDDCDIRPGAYLRENVIIGNNCVIRSELKNCLIMDNSNAAHLSYVGDSILGRNCNLGAGTILSNLKLDEKPIILRINDNDYNTGLQKFGAILGDNVHTGSNALTNPGTLIGKNSFLYPNAAIKGFFPANSIIKLKQELEVVKKR